MRSYTIADFDLACRAVGLALADVNSARIDLKLRHLPDLERYIDVTIEHEGAVHYFVCPICQERTQELYAREDRGGWPHCGKCKQEMEDFERENA